MYYGNHGQGAGGCKYKVFASLADDVIAVRMAPYITNQKLNFTFGLRSQMTIARQVNGRMLTAVIEGADHEGIKAGLKAECRVKIETDGDVTGEGGEMKVSNASSATLYITAATNYVNYHDVSGNA